MKLYLAGPMRGLPEHNFPAFIDGARTIRELGYEVWSPAEKDLESGFDPVTGKAESLLYYMKIDLPALLECDGIVMLPGWERSQGARLEHHVARECGLRIYESIAAVPRKMELVA